MGAWYTIGLLVGLGVGLGVAAAGAFGASRLGIALAAVASAAVGVGLGFAIDDLGEAIGGGIGGIAGALGAAQLTRGTLRRGGTRAGTALLVGLAGLVLAALALIPIVGYLEAVVVPALGARLRRRAGRRYAGLRVLARD